MLLILKQHCCCLVYMNGNHTNLQASVNNCARQEPSHVTQVFSILVLQLWRKILSCKTNLEWKACTSYPHSHLICVKRSNTEDRNGLGMSVNPLQAPLSLKHMYDSLVPRLPWNVNMFTWEEPGIFPHVTMM